MRKIATVLCMMIFVSIVLIGCSKKSDKQSETNMVIEVASLKGPTSLGLLKMMDEANQNDYENEYNFNIYQAADEIVTKVVKGEVDIALVPANVASILYQKTSQQVQVVDINTLGVIYVVEHGDTIQQMSDLVGKTICMTGKGTVPEFAFSYILNKNGLSMEDMNIEFKSEPTEVIAFLSKDSDAVGIIPQPFVSSASMQDENLRIALNLSEEWSKVDTESSFITGVTIVRKEFLDANEEVIHQFLEDHAESVAYVNSNVEEAATIAETKDIVKAAVAKSAIPYCNIVCITGDELQNQLSGYLQTLFDANKESVGGTLPDEGFYYTGGSQEKD